MDATRAPEPVHSPTAALQRSDRRFLGTLASGCVVVLSFAFFACRQLPSRSSKEIGQLRVESSAFWSANVQAAERLDDEVKRAMAEMHGQLDALIERQDAADGR